MPRMVRTAAGPPVPLQMPKTSATVLDAKDAVAIFRAKSGRKARDALSGILAETYGITMKAVRDIWNLRTWRWATKIFWSPADLDLFLSKYLCTECQLRGVASFEEACQACSGPKRRGRPAPIRQRVRGDLSPAAALSEQGTEQYATTTLWTDSCIPSPCPCDFSSSMTMLGFAPSASIRVSLQDANPPDLWSEATPFRLTSGRFIASQTASYNAPLYPCDLIAVARSHNQFGAVDYNQSLQGSRESFGAHPGLEGQPIVPPLASCTNDNLDDLAYLVPPPCDSGFSLACSPDGVNHFFV